MREIRMSGLMSGEGKRNTLQRVTAPFLDSTYLWRSVGAEPNLYEDINVTVIGEP